MFKSLFARLRKDKGKANGAAKSLAEQRAAPRHPARREIRLLFSLSVLDADMSAGQRPLTLLGHTRDVSASGLALVVPRISIHGRDLIHSERALLIELELPTGTIKLQGVPVRYERLEEREEGETGYLLGVRIKGISAHARAELNKYLRTLHRR